MGYRQGLNGEIADRVRSILDTNRQDGATGPRSVADLIDATGLAERTLRRRMTGRSPWTTDELDAIAGVLDVPVGALIATVAA
jgi:hypothetical protein